VSAWKTASLGEIFDIARGGSPRPIQDYITDDEDGVNWISISDASASDKFITETKKRIRPEGVSRSRMVKLGDFLLTNSMSFGRPYIMGTSGCIHDGWLVLSSKHGDVDQDYFFHLLGSDFIYAKFTKLAAGATVKNLNIDLVSGVEVNFPPLEEQRRIAAILDQAETLRTQRRQALAHLDTLTQSLFLDMFGDPVANPKGWLIRTLDEVTTKVTDGEHLNPAFAEIGMPIVMAGNVLDDRIDLNAAKRVTVPLGMQFRKKCGPELGDLLIVGRGATIGRLCRVNVDETFCLMGSVILVKPDRTLLDERFLSGMLVLPSMHAQLYKSSGSSAQQAIYLKDVKKLKCPVPPLALQQTFATRIQAIEALKATHRTALAQLDALFASLQQRAFAGEL
jgi:type I restriction enzyme, S subunit